jgi:hypothetical protein
MRGRSFVSVACAVAATLGVAAPRAAAAVQYTVVDLGSVATEGAADSISASGLDVGMGCATWNGTVHAATVGYGCAFSDVNSSDEAVGSSLGAEVNGPQHAFSETPGQPAVRFLDAPLNNDYGWTSSASAAYAIDDAGEIGGNAQKLNQQGAAVESDAFIYDPGAASAHQVTLLPDSSSIYGLTPDWASADSETAADPDVGPIPTFLTLYGRSPGAPTRTLTNMISDEGLHPLVSYESELSPITDDLADDGTLVGEEVTAVNPGTGITTVPVMRLADGTEIPLAAPGSETHIPQAVNAGHYAVGYVNEGNTGTYGAALWTPDGTLELLNSLIPAGSGWVLQDAVGISDNGAIAGTGTLNGKPENFLLTNNSLLPTATTGVCVPATVAPGKTTSCTFTVADTTPGSTQRPTGTVTVSSDRPGAIAPASQCTLAAISAAGKAACAVSYTPTAIGTPTLTGSYSGDGEHGSSHGTASVTVSSSVPPPPSPKAKVAKPTTSGTSAGASVSCAGAAGSSCSVTLTLSVTETLSGHKVLAVSASKRKPKKTKRTVVLGTTTVKLAAGRTKTVSVSLNGAGKRLLKSRHTLSVKLIASQKAGAKSTFTVKLTTKKGKHK